MSSIRNLDTDDKKYRVMLFDAFQHFYYDEEAANTKEQGSDCPLIDGIQYDELSRLFEHLKQSEDSIEVADFTFYFLNPDDQRQKFTITQRHAKDITVRFMDIISEDKKRVASSSKNNRIARAGGWGMAAITIAAGAAAASLCALTGGGAALLIPAAGVVALLGIAAVAAVATVTLLARGEGITLNRIGESVTTFFRGDKTKSASPGNSSGQAAQLPTLLEHQSFSTHP